VVLGTLICPGNEARLEDLLLLWTMPELSEPYKPPEVQTF